MRLLLVLLFAFGFVSVYGQTSEARTLLAEGRAAYRRGDFDSANQFFSEAYRKDASLDTALFNRGVVQLKQTKYHKAIDDFTNFLRANPSDAQALALCAEAYFGAQDTESGLQQLDKALQLNPQIEWYMMRGLAHMETGNFVSAEKDFAEVLRRNPKHAAAYRSMGDIYFLNDDLIVAQTLYMQAVNLNPKDKNSLLQYGIAQARLSNYVSAISTLTDSVISADPTAGYNARGFSQYKIGAFAEARADAQAALNISISNADAYHLLGLLEAHEGNAIRAVELFDEAIAIDPDHAHAWYNAGKLLYQTKVFDRAASYLSKAMDYKIVRGNAARAMASLKLTLSDDRAACEYFRIASQLGYDPESEEDTNVFCRE
jgi:tetratricopeptide (TPR) repeat protein